MDRVILMPVALFLTALPVRTEPAPPSSSGPPVVTVDATTRVVLGNQDRLDADLFGVTAFEGFPRVVADYDYRARVAALRPGCFRFGGNVAWFAPKTYDPAWYDSVRARTEFQTALLFGARYPFGRFAPVVRALGAEPMVSLGGPPPYLVQPGTRHPSDFDKWARYCVGFIDLWKRFDPQLRLVQIWNEPNASWYKDPRAGDQGTTAAELHLEMANAVAHALKARWPRLQVGGPVLCWPPAWPPGQKGKPPWYTWDTWTLPWLEKTKDTVDFFDFHVYDVAPDDFAVQTEMVYNQALLTQHRPLPVWITESNYNLTPAEQKDPAAIWHKRFLPYERLLFLGILPQADKVAGNLYHDLHAKRHTLLPRSASDPDPMYYLLWILRDLRGLRVVADSTDPTLLAFATMEEDRVTVVVFNDTENPRRVSLAVRMPTGYWTGPYVRAVGQSAQGACELPSLRSHFTRHGGRAVGSVRLGPRTTVSLNFRMQNFGRTHATRFYREFFGDQTREFLRPDRPVTIALRLPKLTGGSVWLRVGLLGPAGGEALHATLNGVPIPLEPTSLQEIPLDKTTLQPLNTLRIELEQPADNPRLALGFASLVVQTESR